MLFAFAPEGIAEEDLPVAKYHFNILSPRTPLLLKEDYLFAGFKDELRVYNVRNRLKPSQIATLKLTGLINDIAEVDDNTLALVNGALLVTVDISSPGKPEKIHQSVVGVPETHGPESLVVRNRRAYITCRKAGLKVYDLSDRSRPRSLGQLKLRGLAKNLALDRDRCYVATQTGVAIVDVSEDKPRLLSFYDSLRSAEEIVLRPPYAMILSKEYFASIDFSDINEPKALGECTTLDLFFFRYPQEALRSGDFVVTAQTEGGLYILDWSDIPKPRVTAQFSTWERKGTDFRYIIATGLALDGLKTAYVMGYDGRLSVFDIRQRRGKFEIYQLARTELPKKK